MIRDPGCHRWCDSQQAVNPAKIVVRETPAELRPTAITSVEDLGCVPGLPKVVGVRAGKCGPYKTARYLHISIRKPFESTLGLSGIRFPWPDAMRSAVRHTA